MKRLGMLFVAALAACGPSPPAPARQAVVDALRGSGGAGFERAERPRPFEFPEDHGPHEAFEVEWWYFTGHLATAEGRRFGYQLTFFRRALAPPARPDEPPRASRWATRQVYLAHFALSDVDGGAFHAAERTARGAAELAGARAAPFRVWVAEWSAERAGNPVEATELLPLRLTAADGEVGIDLELRTDKPMVFHGDRGWSQKSGEAGAASYYFSFPRLETSGQVTVGASRFGVTGTTWMDREWSTGSLGSDQIGWDWFSLQLDDRRDLMLFELRSRKGEPTRAGTLIDKGGSGRSFVPPAGALEVLDHWTNAQTATRYPARWRWRLPEFGFDLEIRPLLANQELDLGFRYWEGAVEVTGTSNGEPVTGRGYVELTGYGSRMATDDTEKNPSP